MKGKSRFTKYYCRMPRVISRYCLWDPWKSLVSSLDSRAGDQHHEDFGGDRGSAHPPEAGKQRQCIQEADYEESNSKDFQEALWYWVDCSDVDKPHVPRNLK